MKIFWDMSSVIWTALRAGKDTADGIYVNHNGKEVLVNSAAYGYENAVNHMVAELKQWRLTPEDAVLVFEGKDSKKRRCMIDPQYKAKRDADKPPEAYEQFNLLKNKLKQTFRDLGAIAVSQDYVEGDDILAWLAQHTEQDAIVSTYDNDLVVLNQVNAYGAKIMVSVKGEVALNKYGDFDLALVTLYKALVGDSSDNVKGSPGFGPTAFMKLIATYGEDGAYELLNLLKQGQRDQLAVLAKSNGCKLLQKIVDTWEEVVKSYKVVLLHPEWVNTIRQQLTWGPGMVKPECNDERLRQWRGQARLVTAENYDAALAFFQSKVGETKDFSIDFETTTPDESDDWLEQRGKNGVDVIGSTVVSMGLNFGANHQYAYYISVDHKDTPNCSLDQLVEFIRCIPQDKHIIAHNAAGFELPVAYNNFGDKLNGNGWRGFIPNMIDSRIAATFWDENQPSHGLKQLTKLLLGYEQGTYQETTTKSAPVGTLTGGKVTKEEEIDGVIWEHRQYKMHELTGKEVTAYGVDDVYTATGLWNFFRFFMQLEHTYKPFLELEQKPMYLSALAYVQGLDIDMPRLTMLEKQDKELAAKCWETIESFLIEHGWDGVTCPVFTELSPATIKQAVQIGLGIELKTMVRTVSKLAALIEQLDHEDAPMLAKFIADERLDMINKFIETRYTGRPEFNVGSPKQIAKLLYEVIGMPIRLRNKATDAMRAAGIKEGNPRTDDGAIDMAIKFKDVGEREVAVLKALLEMKSCNTRNALYWSAIPVHIHWKTGKLHSEIIQSNTNTRRWTSSKINLQQLESNPEGVRSVILDRGRLVTSLDQSSQEVRLMAELSQDEGLLSCYVGNNLRDTHSLVAHRIAGVTYEEFMAMRRSEDKTISSSASAIRGTAKSVFFGYLYGSAAPKTAETLGITEEEAQTYIDAINSAFPGIKRYQEESSNMAETLGYVPLLGGTKRHLAKLVTSEDKWEASKALRQAGNSRIQGAAANQIKTVMTKIWDSHLLDDTSFKWLFCVHDEIVVSTDAHDTVDVIHEVHKIMTEPFLKSLPSESSLGVGKSFGALLEQPENEFSGGRFNKEMLQKAIDSLVT